MKVAALALAAAATACAHHSIESTVDLKKEVRLEGKIISILLRNPHSFLQIEAANQDGSVERWSLEFPKGVNSLRKQGMEPGTLKIGDQVVITMNPPIKPGARLGSLVALHRASDGFEWRAKARKPT
jgi:hypothetical protein